MQLLIRVIQILVVSSLACSAAADQKTNFVLLIADDISVEDLGCYGHPVIKTPNIDRLAEKGMRFTNAYLTISSCSPSRCSIITGRYPHNTGAPELHTTLPKGQVMFPELLRDAGYYSLLSGKNHMGPNVEPAFEKISKGKGPGKEQDWVALLRDRPKDRPFFFWFASTDAHRNWKITDEAATYTPKDVIVPPYLIDGPKTRKDLTGYYHEVSRFDYYVGKVLEELERQGVSENTVVIVMADNGRPFPRCKTRLYDSGIKTPLIVCLPSKVKPSVCESLVSSIDISSTILELAGVEKDTRIQGVSMASLLDDPTSETRKVVFAEHNWHVYKNHERMVRMGDYLYIRNSYPDQQNLCREAYEDGAGEELWEFAKTERVTPAQMNIMRNPCPEEELFHVKDDPHQLKNLVRNPAVAQQLQTMREKLNQWIAETGDSIPADPTPNRNAPPGKTIAKVKNFKHREMPGDRTDAKNNNNPGPTR